MPPICQYGKPPRTFEPCRRPDPWGMAHQQSLPSTQFHNPRERFEPFPIQLPSIGISPGLPDFSADVAAIRSHVTKILDQDNRDVVLVMHSYGAHPGTEAMKGLAKKERQAADKKAVVVALVYIASIVAAKGFPCSAPLGRQTEEEKLYGQFLKEKDNRVRFKRFHRIPIIVFHW